MAYDPGAIDATLAAAVGDEPTLIAELRVAFYEGALRILAQLDAAVDVATWRGAAWRLQGLAASFGAVRLMSQAAEAALRDGPDPVTAAQLRRAVERI